MTTHELQRMNLQDFHQHISEACYELNYLERSILTIQKNLDTWNDKSCFNTLALKSQLQHKLDIKQRTYSRLKAWIRKQVLIKHQF